MSNEFLKELLLDPERMARYAERAAATGTNAEPHPLAGQTVTVNFGDRGNITGLVDMKVDDWWDHLTGSSWMTAEGNPACMMYAMRSGFNKLPADNDVLYGHEANGALAHLFHTTEIVPTPTSLHRETS